MLICVTFFIFLKFFLSFFHFCSLPSFLVLKSFCHALFFVYVSLSCFTTFIHIINFIFLIVDIRFSSIVWQKILSLIIPTENVSNFFISSLISSPLSYCFLFLSLNCSSTISVIFIHSNIAFFLDAAFYFFCFKVASFFLHFHVFCFIFKDNIFFSVLFLSFSFLLILSLFRLFFVFFSLYFLLFCYLHLRCCYVSTFISSSTRSLICFIFFTAHLLGVSLFPLPWILCYFIFYLLCSFSFYCFLFFSVSILYTDLGFNSFFIDSFIYIFFLSFYIFSSSILSLHSFIRLFFN